MNHRAIVPLTAALITLAGCGQTGPLYRPDDQAAHAKYDPANDYAQPSSPPQTAPTAGVNPPPLKPSLSDRPSSPAAAPTAPRRAAAAASFTATPHRPERQSAPPAPASQRQPTPSAPSPANLTPAAPTAAPGNKAPGNKAPGNKAPGNKWSTIEWTPYRAGVDQ